MTNTTKRTKTATRRAVCALLGRGWTRKRIAERLGVDRRTVFNWETGAALPHPRRFVALMEEVAG